MSSFYALIKYSSNEDDSRIKNLISPLLQEYDGTPFYGGEGVTSNIFFIDKDKGLMTSEPIFTKEIKYQFSKEDHRNDFIKSVNSLGEDILAATFL
jgi:hypothetical protein